jgi:hypothetical protein
MIRCLIIDVTERRRDYEWRFQARIPGCDTAALFRGLQRRERAYSQGILCCL